MRKIIDLFSSHYDRYHNLLFYVLAFVIMGCSILTTVHVLRQKNALERERLQVRDIPTQDFTVEQKPIYVALQEAGLSKQEVIQIVSKLGTVADTRKLQKKDTYSLSVENGHFVTPKAESCRHHGCVR